MAKLIKIGKHMFYVNIEKKIETKHKSEEKTL